MTPAKIPNPYLVGVSGPSAVVPDGVCWLLEKELGRELAELRMRCRGINPQAAYALRAMYDAALSFVPPIPQKEHASVNSEEQPPVLDCWLTSKEAARVIGVTTSRAVVLAISRDALPGTKVGRSWRIRRSDAENYRDTRAA